MKTNNLIGTWRLVSYEIRGEDQSVVRPLGEHPVGYLTYTAQGHMHGSLMAKNRPNFTSKEYMSGTTEEKARALESFVSYCGTYEFFGNRVVHHVDVSWYPNWTGKDQERFVKLEKNRLTLTTAKYFHGGKTKVAELLWEKM
jgi:hypothetical protein